MDCTLILHQIFLNCSYEDNINLCERYVTIYEKLCSKDANNIRAES